MPQLEISTYSAQLFWLAITFGFLYACMVAVIVPKMEALLALRHNTIHHDIEAAKLISAQVDEIREAYEQRLLEARTEATALVHRVSVEMQTYLLTQQQLLHERLTEQLLAAEEKISRFKTDVHPEVEELSTKIVQIVLTSYLTKGTLDASGKALATDPATILAFVREANHPAESGK